MRQKKLILIIGIVGIIFFVGTLFYFLKPIAQPIPTGWKTHTDPHYTISYPSDWKQTKEPASEGTESVVVKPANIPDKAYEPILIITSDVLTNGKEPIEKRELPYEQLGFKKSSFVFQGISATKLQGVLPVPGNDQDPTKTFHNT